jgi:murein DD-endopeptidase MepM/ murein hydrolase activator NlpD
MSFTPWPLRRLSRAALVLMLLALASPWAAAAQALYHILEKGETLYSVARAYGLKPEALAEANSIADPAKLRAGMKLLIPGASVAAPASEATPAPVAPPAATQDGAATGQGVGVEYKVVKGDTLFSIAKTYGVSLDALRAVNKLSVKTLIKPGDTLKIPSGGKAIASSTGDKALQPPTAAPAMPDAVKTSAKAVGKGLSWPCPGEILYLDGKAYGVIIKAKQGEVERAVTAGTVSSAGPYRGYGNVVFVLSRTGYIYVYGGNERISVRAGDRVMAGQELGMVGMDAKQGGPAAYFLVFKNGEAVDPAEAPRD